MRSPASNTGKASGNSIDVHQFDVYELRDEQIVRATLGYKSKAEAIEAVGPSAQDAHAD